MFALAYSRLALSDGNGNVIQLKSQQSSVCVLPIEHENMATQLEIALHRSLLTKTVLNP